MNAEIRSQHAAQLSKWRRILFALWPTLLVGLVLGVLTCLRIDMKGSNGAIDGAVPIRATEWVLVIAALSATLGSERLRQLAACFLIGGLAVIFVLIFAERHRVQDYSLASFFTTAAVSIADFFKGNSKESRSYWDWAFPLRDPAIHTPIRYDATWKFIAAWWIAAIAACGQDIFHAIRQWNKADRPQSSQRGDWTISLKGFLLFVTIAAWSLGVLQMSLWRQRYAASVMLVGMTLVAAIVACLPRRAAASAGKAWLLVAGVYLSFLFIVRGDSQAVDMLDPCLSPTVIEIVSVPFIDSEQAWDWWTEVRNENYYFLYDPKIRGYVITWTSLLCIWLATTAALLRYRRALHEKSAVSPPASLWSGGGQRRSIFQLLMLPLGVGLFLAALTTLACFSPPEQAAHLTMKVTEAGYLGLLLAALAAPARWRTFAARFLTVGLALLFVEQFATFYRLEHEWGDSPFLRLYGWLWNVWHGEPVPPYEHEWHLLLRSLTYRQVDYLIACECIASWWSGAIAALALDFFYPRSEVGSTLAPFWTPWRRVSLLCVTLTAVAMGIWICNHPTRRYIGMSILEVTTLIAVLGVGISSEAWSGRAKRWLLGLAVYLGLVIVAHAHNRKWDYFDFGLSTSIFDLLYLHLFHGEPLAFWKIAPPADSQLIDPAAKDWSIALIGVFGVWYASVAAICWRPALDLEPESRPVAG